MLSLLEEKATVGDLVLIKSCRPYSKRKCFELKEILKRSPEFLYEQDLRKAAEAEAAKLHPPANSEADVVMPDLTEPKAASS